MNQEELKIKKREIQTRVQELNTSIGNPNVIYPSIEAAKAAKKELEDLIAEYQKLPLEERLVTTLTMGISISLGDQNNRYSLRYVGNGKWWFYEGSLFKTADIEWNEDFTEAKVKVGTVNSDTQGETVNYVYMVKIMPSNDPVITKVLTMKQSVTAQEPKQAEQSETKKTPRQDQSLLGFGIIYTPDGRLMSKNLYEAELKAEHEAEEQAKIAAQPKTKKRKGLFS